MQINWKLRLKNKATLVTLCVAVLSCIYTILATFGITPSVTQDQVMNVVLAVLSILVALGIVVDPTTAGVNDSQQAMSYEEPRKG